MAIVVIAGLVISMLYSRFVKKKGLELSAAESASLNFGKEEIDILINSDFGRCKEHLKGQEILAANYVYHIPTAKDQMKTAAWDVLKSILTLGTVKFTTVQVPVPLVLADDGLHVFQLDADEKVKDHFLFSNERLAEATIKETPDTIAPKELGNSACFYELSIPTDSGVKTLELCSILYPTRNTFLAYSYHRRVLAFAAGKKFFKVLGEKYPNLNMA